MTDRVVEALREIAPVARGQVAVTRMGQGERPGTEQAGAGRMLRWVECGTGTPTVVLVAGRNDTALSWGPMPAALAMPCTPDRPARVAEAILTCGQ